MWGIYRFIRNVRFVIVLIVVLVLGLSSLTNTFSFLPHSGATIATVTGNTSYDGPHGPSYCPQLQFVANGSTITAQGQEICQDNPFVVGSTLPVRYLLADPSQVRVDSLPGIWGFTGLAAGSILFVGALVALLMIVTGSRRRAPAPAQAQWMAGYRQPMAAQARPALARPRGRHANGTCLSCAQTNALAATCCVACGAPF